MSDEEWAPQSDPSKRYSKSKSRTADIKCGQHPTISSPYHPRVRAKAPADVTIKVYKSYPMVSYPPYEPRYAPH